MKTPPYGNKTRAARSSAALGSAVLACALLLFSVAPPATASEPAFYQWAQKPPMGWNSWDCFATTVTESQTKAQADYMADRLARYGWQYIVVDIQWYEPHATGYDYRKNAPLVMDEYGRLTPATNRFPSAVNRAGFKPLSDYVHGKGLEFGLHLLRGIPRQAVAANTPIKGTTLHAADIANTRSTCPWNGDMYGVDMSKPGAQEYYNSVFELFAEWDVDFVKVDDIARPYHAVEIEGIRKAIDHSGRPMVLSLSPGETPLAKGAHVSANANMWRISDDFWDNWKLLLPQFDRLRNWTPNRGPGHFPDADMLPLGIVGMGRRTKFTRDEQYTLMSLWCVARSPLIFGGDMSRMDDFTLSLLTNAEVLAVNQNSSSNRELFHRDGLVAWTADVPGSGGKYLALFNTRDGQTNGPTARISVDLAQLGLSGRCLARDLWRQADIGVFENQFSAEINAHGAGLFRLASERLASFGTATRSEAGGASPGSASDEVAYLFSYFIGNGEDGLHLGTSRDGYAWQALNGGQSFLRPQVGESKLMRDPCLIRTPDGLFHMVWTTSWGGTTIGYASSRDLVHWSAQQAIPVMAQEPATLNCWAPEIFWEADQRRFLLFWASTVTNRFLETAGQAENHYNHRIYSTTTSDFKTFSPSALYFEPGFNVIDATLLAAHGRYYLIFKDETVRPPRKHLRISTGQTPEGPFGPPGPPFTPDWVEGPTAIRLGDDYLVYFDCYRDHHYGAVRSKDLVHWEDVTSRLSMPKDCRHGTVLAVAADFLRTLRGARPLGEPKAVINR